MVTGKQFAVASFLIAIVGLVANAHWDWNLFEVTGGTNYNPEYPFAAYDKVYSPVFGQIECKDTGLWSQGDQLAFTNDGCYQTIFGTHCTKSVKDYSCQSYGGCRLFNLQATCPYANVGVSPHFTVKVDNFISSYPYDAVYGQSYHIEVSCYAGASPPSSTNDIHAANTVDVLVKGKIEQLYVTSWGYTPGGWLAGSEGCKLISASADTLKKMQPIHIF
jgi:hypothetical protein